jgi:very-short-patch-repair endonuclease
MGGAARTRVLDLAATQCGLFADRQAIELGIGRAALRSWARCGEIERVLPHVWGVAGAPDTDDRRAMAAVLSHGPGAVLAIRSAAWVWEVPGHELGVVDVLHRRGEHLPGPARAHTSKVLEPVQVTQRRGLPVTTPCRTIFDLAGRQHPGRTARDLNHLRGRGLLRTDDLHAELDRLARRGRRGIAVMRELIARIDAGEEPTESTLELRCRELLHLAGYRGLEQQVELGDDGGFVARVDFLHRALRIVVEVDSDRFHGGILDRMLDDEKTRRLEAAGWIVVRVPEREIFWEQEEVVHRLRRAHVEAGRRARLAGGGGLR